MFMGIAEWMDRTFPQGIYLRILSSVFDRLYHWTPVSLLNRRAKRALNRDISPRWVAELYQLLSVLLGIVLLIIGPQEPSWLRLLVVVYCFWGLAEIVVVAMRWIFVARDPVESLRRSLAAFILTVFEVALLSSVLIFLLGCKPPELSTAQLLYNHVVSIFTLSVPSITGSAPACSFVAHTQVVIGWLLLLIVLTVVAGGITRDERDKGPR